MKKIIKEWKEWLNETKPTEKYFKDIKRHKSDHSPKDQHYNRAVTSAMGQRDFRSTFKVWLGQFFQNPQRSGQMEWLNNQMNSEEQMQAARDLGVMRYIYSGQSHYDIYGRDNVKSGILFDNQPEVNGSPVEMIDFLLDDMGLVSSQKVPSEEEQREVYIYYIKPNYAAAFGPEASEPTKKDFRSSIAMSQSSEFMKRQAELDAINKQKAIERKKELARRRKERRRNK